MRKTQVALAALALVASSAALAGEVTMSGIIDFGVGHYSGSKGSFMEQGAWADHSSITFAGNEDLGGGLKAYFTMEAGFDQNGNVANGGNGNLFSRQSLVGVSSAELGSLSLGQQLSPYILAQALTNQGVGNFWVNRVIMGGGLQNAARTIESGGTNAGFFMKNSVQYTSPNIAGWQAYAMMTTKNGQTGGTVSPIADPDQYYSLAVNGNIAGVNLWLANQDSKDSYRSWTIGASYPVTAELNVSANFINHKDKVNELTTKSWAIGATYKVAPAASLVAQYTRNNLDDAQSIWNIGGKYDLSKRTAAYITYTRATNGAISTIGDRGNYTNDGSVTDSNSATFVGITHSF